MTKKFFTLFFALVASVGTMFAWDYERVKIGDLYYNLDATNQTAEVTYKSYTNYNYNEGWGITTANIPASVEFYDGVGYSVTSIGDRAFYDCTGLTSVTIPNSVTSIGDWAFNDCTGLTSVTIPNSVTSIGEDAFYGCSGLTSVAIGNSVTSIGKWAFEGCSGLTSIEIPNSVTSIGDCAFLYCFGLTSVHISDIAAWCAISFGKYNANPLSYAHNLYLNGELVTDLVIPNSVKSIGDEAFSGCSGLTSVTIPNSVTSIGEDAFYDVPNIVYSGYATGSPWGARSINGYVDGYLVYSDVTKTTLRACSSSAQGEIIIPNSVKSIGDEAFSGCSGLTSVTIPNSVTSIGDEAFNDCTGLTSVTIEAETPPTLGEEAFYYTNNCPIYVPCNAVNAYKTAWSEYADRIVANCASYTITFVNWDGNELLKLTGVEHGTMPVYTGNTPTRPDDAFYTYTFKGWSPNIVEATQDATYVAVYDEHPRTTDIKEVSAKTNVVKILRNGQLYILRNGKAYSVQGQEVK